MPGMTDFAINNLAGASSPYLRQHAGNPVHWQQWNAATLAHARATDTPILLSIGYSACHWCHVMAHECFEDPAIAAAMNAAFVNIKLDREERPDIDQAYQLAHQALSQRGGGWPLTAFLDPEDLAPFYIGTYFPPTPRHGLPGFPDVLQRVRSYFDSHRDDLRAQTAHLRDWLQHAGMGGDATVPDADATDAAALQRMAARFDPQWGGNAGAPKFPRPAELEWLLDLPAGRPGARRMARQSVTMMAARGLRDHLGGGFFRYCVDAAWTIPHFEKMLYDNAALLPVFARVASDANADAATRATARSAADGIVAWLARDMAAPDGAFYASLDADSEGEEGKYYLWTRAELDAALPAADVALATRAFGLDGEANFEGRAWHLLRATPLVDVARALELPAATVEDHYAAIRARLLAARGLRPAPTRDDKILTAWNALAIAGLARSARLLDDARCSAMARAALKTLRAQAWGGDELFANVADPQSRIPGFLDDHAFLLDALLETLQLDFTAPDIEWAIQLADTLLERFADPAGGFWFSSAAHATPLARGRSWTDDALPNGNGVAIRALLRLGHLLGETRYLDAAERALRAAAPALAGYPDACPTLLRALHEFANPRLQIVVRCTAAQAADWRRTTRAALQCTASDSAVRADIFVVSAELSALPGILRERTALGTAGTAYICAGTACQAPVTTPTGLVAALRMAQPQRSPDNPGA